MRNLLWLTVAALLSCSTLAARDPTECEVCIRALTEIRETLTAEDKTNLVSIEDKIAKFCAKPKNDKDVKLCYYLDPIKREISQPMKNGVPTDKICERLKKKSAEICALRFASSAPPPVESIDDFNKLRIKDLKNIMAEKGISCPECLEKSDFVQKLEKVLGKPSKSEL